MSLEIGVMAVIGVVLFLLIVFWPSSGGSITRPEDPFDELSQFMREDTKHTARKLAFSAKRHIEALSTEWAKTLASARPQLLTGEELVEETEKPKPRTRRTVKPKEEPKTTRKPRTTKKT